MGRVQMSRATRTGPIDWRCLFCGVSVGHQLRAQLSPQSPVNDVELRSIGRKREFTSRLKVVSADFEFRPFRHSPRYGTSR